MKTVMSLNSAASHQSQNGGYNLMWNLLIPNSMRRISLVISNIILFIGLANVATGVIGCQVSNISSDPVIATRINIWVGSSVSRICWLIVIIN